MVLELILLFVVLASFNVGFFLSGIRHGERVIRKHGRELLLCADECSHRRRSHGLNCAAEDSEAAARALRKQLDLPDRSI